MFLRIIPYAFFECPVFLKYRIDPVCRQRLFGALLQIQAARHDHDAAGQGQQHGASVFPRSALQLRHNFCHRQDRADPIHRRVGHQEDPRRHTCKSLRERKAPSLAQQQPNQIQDQQISGRNNEPSALFGCRPHKAQQQQAVGDQRQPFHGHVGIHVPVRCLGRSQERRRFVHRFPVLQHPAKRLGIKALVHKIVASGQ